MKKLMLLALTAISALLVTPTFASATPAHLSSNPGEFSVHGGESTFSRTDGVSTTGTTVTGSGTFENSTTGTMNLKFHGVKDSLGRSCASTGEPAGTVNVPGLRFHLIMFGILPGTLITPPASGHFATYVCGSGLFATTVTVKGNGIIGTNGIPGCGGTSASASFNFQSLLSTSGHQVHNTYTSTNYDLSSTLNGGSVSTSALDAIVVITFESSPTLNCTVG